MTMTPGQFGEQIAATSQTLGSATGRVYGVNNSTWALLATVHILWVTTATAGTRIPVLRVLDAASNILWEGPITAGPGASVNPARVSFGAGVPLITSTPYFVGPLPVRMILPPFASVQILDAAAIDNADTIQPNIVYSM